MEKRPLKTLLFQIFSWHAGAYWLGTNMCNAKCLGNYNVYEPMQILDDFKSCSFR